MRRRIPESDRQRIRRLIIRHLGRSPADGLTRHWLAGSIRGAVFTSRQVDGALKSLVADGLVERVEVTAPLRFGLRPTHQFTLYRLARVEADQVDGDQLGE